MSSSTCRHPVIRPGRLPWLVAAIVSTACRGSGDPSQAGISPEGLTRFEMQRLLLDVDEQRRRLETRLEPVDSVVAVLEGDTARIAASRRSRLVDRDVERVWALAGQLKQTPEGADLTRRFVEAVRVAARNFSVPDSALKSRLVPSDSATALTLTSAAVAIDDRRQPYNSALWTKIRSSDYGRLGLPNISAADVLTFQAAVSDSGFVAYKETMIGAFARRISDVRQGRDSTRGEIQRLRKRATDLAHSIGADEMSSARLDARLINFGLPAFGIVLILLLFMPLLYKRPEVQQWLLTSGLLLELATMVLVTAATLLLALSGRIHGEVVGTLLGALCGYTLGRATHRRSSGMPELQPLPALPASTSTTNLPATIPRRTTPAAALESPPRGSPVRTTPPPLTPPKISPPPLVKQP